MGKNREPRDLDGGAEEGLDLLEVGPDDEGELLEFEDGGGLQARIKVFGCGGAGGNALDTMIRAGLSGVEFVAANTDAQALEHKLAPTKVQLGTQVTRGLGCGANPEKGRAAALEDRDKLRDLLIGSDMVFVTAGLGGGTGTGAAPVIAEVAREIGALTVAVVTKPFPFEGRQRTKHAEAGLDELHRVVDTLITIPNQRLLALVGKDTPMTQAFTLADDVLLNAVKGISDLITVHGLINLDFADVRTIMNEMGMALMGTGMASGENRAQDAAYAAISSPLLEDVSIDGARGVLINITGGPDMTLYEVNEASSLVQEAAHEDANIIFGAVIDETVAEGDIRVTVIATGLDDGRVRVGERTPITERVAELRPLEAPAAEAPAHVPPPAAEAPAPESIGLVVEEERPTAERLAQPDEFVSPFEGELDVPTFLRRRRRDGGTEEEEEERESPAFLRRSAD
ncbi:MAG: cell division protein FtsZ [Deltaproteobacteria bacterium]|nr:cell division protein FtsZ [Deltaproteobacteria bacterium]